MLLTSEGSGQNSFSNITGNIREVGLLGNSERERNIGKGKREKGREKKR